MTKEELLSSIENRKKEIEDLKEKLVASEKESLVLDSINAKVEPSLPKSEQALSLCSSIYSSLIENKVELAKLKEIIKTNEDHFILLDDFIAELPSSLNEIYFFAKNNNYLKAYAKLDSIKEKFAKLDYFSSYAFFDYVLESLDYVDIFLTQSKLKNFIDIGEEVSLEDASNYHLLASMLKTKFHSLELKNEYLDESLIYLVKNKVSEENNSIHSSSTLIAFVSFLDNVDKELPLCSTDLAKEKEIGRKVALNEYNELSKLYFDDEPNLECSLILFSLRGRFSKDEISSAHFLENKNEEEFKMDFISSTALRKDASSYNDQVLVLSKKAMDGDDESFNLLARFLCMRLIDSTKFDITLKAIKDFNFKMLLLFFSKCVELGLDEEKQVLLFNVLDKTKQNKRKGNLEEMAIPLYYLSFHIAPSLKNRFICLKKDLLRSPKAHKIKNKTHVNELRYLYEEDPNLNKAIGKKAKDLNIKSWDCFNIVTYYFLMAFIPAILSAVSLLLFYFFEIEKAGTSFIYAIPLSFYPVFFGFIGLNYFGRDEKGSSWFRRILGLDAIIKLIVCTIYFIIPTYLPSLSLWSMPLLVSGAFSYAYSLLLFKEHKKWASYAILISFLILLILSLVFIVIDQMQSLIH